MRTVNIAKLKDQLSKYVRYARNGQEIIIRDRNVPVAKLVPFEANGASAEDLALVAAGKMTLPKQPLDIEALSKIPTGKLLKKGQSIQAILDDREESL